MRKLNPVFLAYIHTWVEYASRSPIPALGLPSMTSEAKLRESPGRSNVAWPKAAPLYMPTRHDRQAMAVDKAISCMIEQQRIEEVVVFYVRHLYGYSERTCHSVLGIRAGQYRWLLEKAYRGIGKHLSMRIYA
jgi:hypothetical protein